nr:SUMF1/EgtB/PvdO family nonheme iron enzyme [uncultured Psychroserpens sp.]
MQGNILEWCSDWLQDDYSKDTLDPKGPNTGKYRVQRGGQFTGRIRHTRAADRQRNLPEVRDFYVGFRLAHSALDN